MVSTQNKSKIRTSNIEEMLNLRKDTKYLARSPFFLMILLNYCKSIGFANFSALNKLSFIPSQLVCINLSLVLRIHANILEM